MGMQAQGSRHTGQLDEGLVLAGAALEEYPGGGQARDLVLRPVQRQHWQGQVLAMRLHRLDSLHRRQCLNARLQAENRAGSAGSTSVSVSSRESQGVKQ